MKTEWDYTSLADAYLKRPDYAADALTAIHRIAGIRPGMDACDVGAGVGHLSLHLAAWGLNVVAIEPNDAMRSNGVARTATLSNIRWVEAISERTGQPDSAFDFVSFGSSFNVADRGLVMKEVYRILRPRRWFSCMWNHRDLKDPIQQQIEGIFHREIIGYGYGSRRDDQSEVIARSGLFCNVTAVEGRVVHRQLVSDVVEAWRSHATLERQAGPLFHRIVDEVERYLRSLRVDYVDVPYTTRAWVAQRLA
jgi:ubiquinone/menaquinone biosynthesis C-methylase UbiE